MKKGQIGEGTVLRTEFGGKGLVVSSDGEVEVKGTLEGQKIRFCVTKKRGGKCEGRLLEVLERSPDEIESDCPHFGSCGGCSLRTLPYEKQLELKERQVRSILEKTGMDPHFEGIIASPVVDGYRNKMEFSFGDEYKDGPMTLGLHRKGSYHDILTVPSCRIIDDDFRMILSAALDTASRSGLPYYHRMRHVGYFRHLVLRKGFYTGELLIHLITSSQADPETENRYLEEFVGVMTALPLKGKIAGILHTVNDRCADIVASDRTDLLFGRDYYMEQLLHLTFRISPFSFFQNNSPGAQLLYQKAREYIGSTKDKTVFDLYSGTGTIAQLMAPVAKNVVGVEIVEEAVRAARENAAQNDLDNCSFIAGDVLKVLDELSETPDLIILDPPREGVHPKALSKIAAYGADRIVYISCKPTSLPEDMAILSQAGYRIARSCAVDMFCGTAHVETVCLLTHS